MKKEISTQQAPAAIGPYSQGIEAAGFVFVSGQLPITPQTGELTEMDIKAQTRQSISNLNEILKSANMTLGNVLKTTVFLSDMNNFSDMNEVYQEMFGEEGYPARSAVEVARLPKDALVEVEAIAFKK